MSDEPIKVRRKSAQPFAMVPHTLARDPDLSDKAFRLWIVLQSHADFDERDCSLFQSTLAREMNTSRTSVWRAQSELIDRGLLELESGRNAGAANVYIVVDNPGGVFHPRDTPSRAHATPGVSPTRDKENENQLNERGTRAPVSPNALRPFRASARPGPTDFSDADPNVKERVAEIRASLGAAK